MSGKFLLIYICNFHVLSNLLLIYICKLHWNLYTHMKKFRNELDPCLNRSAWTRDEELRCGNFLLIYICNFHFLSNLLLIYICKLHWNLNTLFVCQVNYLWFTYVISMSLVIYYWFTYVNSTGISSKAHRFGLEVQGSLLGSYRRRARNWAKVILWWFTYEISMS